MGRSLTTKPVSTGSGSSDPFQDPHQQACFSVYSMEYGGGGGGFFMYDHNLNQMSHHRGDGNQAYSNYRTYSEPASEFMQNYHGWTGWQTTSHMNSNSERCSGTSFVGYLGHTHFTPASKHSSTGGWVRNAHNGYEYAGRGFRDCNVIVNETHQDWAWFGQHSGGNTRLRFMQRSTNIYWHAHQYDHYAKVDANCKWSQGMYGGCCYNKKTNKVCIMESGGSYNQRPVVFENVPDLRQHALRGIHSDFDYQAEQTNSYSWNTSRLADVFNSQGQYANNYTTYSDHSNKPTNQTDEDNWRGITVLCDNDKVVMFQMIPHYGSWIHRWDASGNAEGNIRSMSHTTSYGIDQGSRYGARWQVTSDGRYVAAYCPSYYYGSGFQCAWIRVSDGKILYHEYNDGTYGYQICPIGKSNFLMQASWNSDGAPGMYYSVVNMDRYFHDYNENDHLDPINWCSSWMIDTPYYSTAYPTIIPAQYDTSLFNQPNLQKDMSEVATTS